ncbi:MULTISPECIES: helix-turn-helix domain-containing protein [Lactobacillus]|uniref:XRE family transcriptional regulator n=1 Tax=Lactobacillus xujianguonis TaxID=2495899 RepID=A0A437SSX4_9LACO|nr:MULTISPECIES: helix-turn-helix transcriptional regulator [Lactobacillus]RVU70056.1 XRE family transcriptional regulator [Lactobacillus xujianguonis]RVU71894.1 XRE family transcriptional regulator [Lactobacillus xujianguonis]
MKIGEALRKERKKLGLSQQQMCAGIISRPHYAKIEKDEYAISSENLFQILLKNKIDIEEFYHLIQDTYDSEENKRDKSWQEQMDEAVNTKDLHKLENLCQEILISSNNEILKMRTIVTVAYFKGELNQLSEDLRAKIKANFDEGKHWTDRPDLLRLFTNTMPLWSQEELEFFIGRLLARADKGNLSELMTERYLRTFVNYLVLSYERQVHKDKGTMHNTNHLDEVINYAWC